VTVLPGTGGATPINGCRIDTSPAENFDWKQLD